MPSGYLELFRATGSLKGDRIRRRYQVATKRGREHGEAIGVDRLADLVCLGRDVACQGSESQVIGELVGGVELLAEIDKLAHGDNPMVVDRHDMLPGQPAEVRGLHRLRDGGGVVCMDLIAGGGPLDFVGQPLDRPGVLAQLASPWCRDQRRVLETVTALGGWNGGCGAMTPGQ